MTGIWQRFVDLKTQIGGNREKTGFEYTFGTPREEVNRVTMPNALTERVISELEFAIKLSETENGRFADAVESALTLLEAAMAEAGTLPRQALLAAENALLPAAEAAKEYTVLCCAHAHIDMNWMWGWSETVAATLSTFRTMLNLMAEYPDFTFSQSQAAVYQIVENYDPDMMREIRARVEEGRWEITATAWVETDKNMPDAESLLRHIRYTRDYLQKNWGVSPESLQIDFSPDTFGHSPFVPEIDAYGGVKYYYHCRGRAGSDVLYRWRAPSGREVLIYKEPYWYNSGITPHVGTGALEVSKLSGGLKTSLIVYGVGDHGGGPSRHDVEKIMEISQWPVFPQVRFGTFREYFAAAEAVREKLTLEENELNFLFDGCYTTQSRIKKGNRFAENALETAEGWDALRGMLTHKTYPAEKLTAAWRNVLFTHFHDILPGSCVQDSREHAMGLFAEAMATANTCHALAAREIAEMTDTSMIRLDEDIRMTRSEGAGVGYGVMVSGGVPNPERGAGKTRIFTVFNPAAHARTENIVITVWDWMGIPGRAFVRDATGVELPFEMLDTELQQYWDHKFLRFAAQVSVPAMGYQTIVFGEKPATEYPTYRLGDERVEPPHDSFTLENEFLRAEIDGRSGAVISLVDQATGEEQLCPDRVTGLMLVEAEEKSNNAWHIGRYLKETPVTDARRIVGRKGALISQVEVDLCLLDSTVHMVLSLGAGDRALRVKLTIEWNERGRAGQPVPVLVYRVPLKQPGEMFRMDVPAGVVDRAPRNADLPASTFVANVRGARALALVTDSKYGYRIADGAMAATLINTSASPDKYPERGTHEISLWLAVGDSSRKALRNLAVDLNRPFTFVPTGAHKGALPAASSLFAMEAGTSVLSSVGACEGGLLVRVYETEGERDTVTIQTQVPVRTAALVGLDGKTVGSAQVADGRVMFDVAPHQIAAVKIQF